MKYFYTIFFLLLISLSFQIKAQCFECIKTYGGFGDDYIKALEVTNNGFASITTDNYSSLKYYDNNCNLIWEKMYNATFPYTELHPRTIRADKNNNLYVFEYNFVHAYEGKNITKFDQTGKQLWEIIFANRNGSDHPLSGFWNAYLVDYEVLNNKLYIIGYFTNVLIFNDNIIYDFRNTDNHTNRNFFISEFDLDGNYQNTKIISRGNGGVTYNDAVIDNDENLYLLRNNNSNIVIEKYNKQLDLIYSKKISEADRENNIEIFSPDRMFYSTKFNKIIIFAQNTRNTNIGNETIIYNDSNYSNRNVLIGINPNNGEVINYKKIDFIPNGTRYYGNQDLNPMNYYFDYTEKDDHSYIITNFNKEININGNVIKPKISKEYEYTTSEDQINYDTNIISFKINPENFDLTPLLYTNKGSQEIHLSREYGKFIRVIDKDNILISGEFQSLNFQVNGIHIPNKSGNLNRDYFIYKYNLNNKPNNISINIDNSCFGEETKFTIEGDFESVKWDFGDGNSSTDKNPVHTYTKLGKYIVKTTVTCKGETREFTNEVNIQSPLKLEVLHDIIVCENNAGEGIGTFDTSDIPKLLTNNQTNYTLIYYDTNGNEINNFISKTYQNKNPFQEKIIVKGYFNENINCVSETSFLLKTSSKSDLPILKQDLNFCINENKTFNDISIDGDNLKFYNSSKENINPNDKITTGIYYVTQTETSKCESNKLELNINIQDTKAPIAENIQSFCVVTLPTLNSIQIEGENINWYDSETSTSKLDNTTFLEDNKTYYASQTINNCESVLRTPVKIQLNTYTLLTSNPFQICKEDNSFAGYSLSTKSGEIAQLLGNINPNSVLYYETLQDAQNNVNILSSTYINRTNKIEIYATSISTNACKTFVKIPLEESIYPTLDILDNYFKCKNETYTITLNETYDEIIWSDGQIGQSSSFTNPGKYKVTVTNGYCSVTKEFEIINYDNLNIEYKYDGKQVHFTILNDLYTQIGLDGINYSPSTSFTLDQGEHTFYFKSSNNCIEVKKIYLYKDLPSILTPNGDGKNDIWDLSYINDLINVKIFNRFGRTIFEATKDNQPIKWDGKYQLRNLPTDTYWYIIDLENGKKIQGSILIKNK
ncbi:T9SS type B sorting domain-containing protein [Empedobacter stercoris]|uniref:T9SS type B sorting domain-containing protein n=1 Tax=Empedobacter stercoris TaxID=1628248 RepID=UPI00293D6A4D|nr:T9SS type B sorting domain-containing protein [Empedobacter stercoris]MCA4776204.1 T9SS type B sorting domain-containing protein [Empedobacter stercoris]